MKRLASLSLLLLTSSSLPDMTGVGEAASKLPDPQSVMFYFLLVLNIAQFSKDIIGGYRHDRLMRSMAATMDRVSQVMSNDTLQITVGLAMVQRSLDEAKGDRATVKEVLKAKEQTGK